MTTKRPQPDPATRWVSHLIVGGAAAIVVSAFVSRKQTPQAQIIGAVLGMAMHELFDAPVASALGDAGL